MIFGFGVAVLCMDVAFSRSEYGRSLDKLATSGTYVMADRASTANLRDGLQRPYRESSYRYRVDGKVHTYKLVSYDDEVHHDRLELAYLRGDPATAMPGVREHAGKQRWQWAIPIGFMAVGLLLLTVTVLRRGVHRETRQETDRLAAAPEPEKLNRVFHYRQPINLWLPIGLIAAMAPFGVGGFLAAARGEVTVNGVPGDGTFQWAPAIFFVLVSLLFLALAVVMLLTYANERIEWKGGWISWHDRFGRLRVRVPLSEIESVHREDTMFVQREDTSFGPFRRVRRSRVEKVIIETQTDAIQFLATIDWAPILEAWATTVASRNRASSRDDGTTGGGRLPLLV
ncbi:MAG: hypothetical protein HONBIEJF_01169 [Fimbriimonadaceae bacterium]|nr:hypothetical protein [Fimbriimonadaceae bacterium]